MSAIAQDTKERAVARVPETVRLRAERYLRALGLPTVARIELLQAAMGRVEGAASVEGFMQALREVMAEAAGNAPEAPHATLWARTVLGRAPDELRGCAHPALLRRSMVPQPYVPRPLQWLHRALSGLRRQRA